MYEQADKSDNGQRKSKSNAVSQRKAVKKMDGEQQESNLAQHSVKTRQAAQLQAVADNFVDKKAIQRVAHSAMVVEDSQQDGLSGVTQLKANPAASTSAQSGIIQFGKPKGVKNKTKKKRKRPGFSGPARKLRKGTDSSDDLAHRLSYHDIEQIVDSGNKLKVTKLIQKLTIPQRRFGKYNKGDKSYYNEVIKINDDDQLIKALNNSPFNLRPGNASVNRSIGAGFDPNVDDDGYDTDQTESLRPFAISKDVQGRTSSYLPDDDLEDWEDKLFDKKNF